MSFRIMLDRQRFTKKADADSAVGAITNRLKTSNPVEVDEDEFCKAIANGQTWVGGCFEPGATDDKGEPKWGAFISQQLFAIDIDNATEVIGADGKPAKDANGKKLKRPLYPGEAGYLGIPDALKRCEQLELQPMLVYLTLSARADWQKYRIVFDMGEPVTDELHAKAIAEQLLLTFAEADQACSNLNRLFFGSNGTVKQAWRASDDER